MEDLIRYIEEIVEPTIEDFARNPTSVRHAFLACVAVFHSVDYLAFPRKSKSLRQKFGKSCPEFLIVDKVAHAFKHVATGNPRQPDLRAGQVISRPPAVWGEAVWNLSRWNDAEGGVTLDSNREIDLLSVIRKAAAFLRSQTEGER